MPVATAHSSTCPKCGAPIVANAPEGLCPRCVAALSLQDDTATDGADESPAPPPQIDERLDSVVRRALHENPEMRHRTAADMRTHLETLLISPDRPRRSRRPSDGEWFGTIALHIRPRLPRWLDPGKALLVVGSLLVVAAFSLIQQCNSLIVARGPNADIPEAPTPPTRTSLPEDIPNIEMKHPPKPQRRTTIRFDDPY